MQDPNTSAKSQWQKAKAGVLAPSLMNLALHTDRDMLVSNQVSKEESLPQAAIELSGTKSGYSDHRGYVMNRAPGKWGESQPGSLSLWWSPMAAQPLNQDGEPGESSCREGF